MIFTGSLADTIGRRSLLIYGLLLFGIGSVVGGCATSIALIIIGRALQGLGAASCSPAILSLITTGYPDPARRNAFIGVYSAASAAGFGVGMIVGGALNQYIGWRADYLYNVPIVISAAYLIARLIPPERRANGIKLSYLWKPLFLSIAVLVIIYGVENLQEEGRRG